MEKKKRLGVWVDYTDAHLMEFKTDIIELNTIESTFTHQEKIEEENKRKRQAKEKRKHAKFYKDLSETIKYYDEVVIFGPNESKNELVNILRSDDEFSNIIIEVKDTDKLNENQQNNFVKEHFLKN
jgi:stalled ribosome rescue protein Dom34